MFSPKKTVTINDREFSFQYPTGMVDTALQTEALRRMVGIPDMGEDFKRLYFEHYLDIAMSRLITAAPDNWYEGEGDKRVLRIDKFYSHEEEFQEVRTALVAFLNSFPKRKGSAESVSQGNGAKEVESAQDVSAPIPVPKSGPDLGRGTHDS